MFLSERDGYSIDAYFADAASGVLIRKFVSAASDPHVASLQFLDAAGAWDQSGRRFALTVSPRVRVDGPAICRSSR